MKKVTETGLMFFDEPTLSCFGSSAFITITADKIIDYLTGILNAARAG